MGKAEVVTDGQRAAIVALIETEMRASAIIQSMKLFAELDKIPAGMAKEHLHGIIDEHLRAGTETAREKGFNLKISVDLVPGSDADREYSKRVHTFIKEFVKLSRQTSGLIAGAWLASTREELRSAYSDACILVNKYVDSLVQGNEDDGESQE